MYWYNNLVQNIFTVQLNKSTEQWDFFTLTKRPNVWLWYFLVWYGKIEQTKYNQMAKRYHCYTFCHFVWVKNGLWWIPARPHCSLFCFSPFWCLSGWVTDCYVWWNSICASLFRPRITQPFSHRTMIVASSFCLISYIFWLTKKHLLIDNQD